MGMCCEKKSMIGWRNVWSIKWRVLGQEVDQRKLAERLWKKTVEHVDWIRRMPCVVVNGESRQGWLMTTMSVVGECFFWYRLTRVVPDKFHRAVKWSCVCVCTLVTGTRLVKPIWIYLLEQDTVSGSGISWAIWKSAPRPRHITTPASHQSVFTGCMLFLPPSQQHQSTEGSQ